MAWRKGLSHPVGLALLLASMALAVLAAFGTPWAGREMVLIAWGITAYVANAGLMVWRLRPANPNPQSHTNPRAADVIEAGSLVRSTADALRHLNNPAALARCALASCIPLTLMAAGRKSSDGPTPLEQAQLLRTILNEGIEKLKLDAEGGPEALQYHILHEEYVLGRPNTQIITRHYITEAAFFRHRRRAIEALASELAAQEARLSAT